LNIGDNTIEAIAADKKSIFKNILRVQAGETPKVEVLFFANNKFLEYVRQGNTAMVEEAIKKNPILASNGGEILACSPIEIAIQNSQLDIIKLLISKGASFTTPTAIFPLHKSILFASSEKPNKDKPAPDQQLLDYFLSQGCKITDKDDFGNTPLHSAAQAGKIDLVSYLIEKGADVNAKNDLGDTPLKIAEDKGYISIIDILKPKPTVEKLQAEGSIQPVTGSPVTGQQVIGNGQ
jgi:ankyrin repeat protein